MPEDESKPQPAGQRSGRKKVTLKKEHTHRGETHPPGAQIEVTPSQEKRLQRREKI